MRERPLRKSQGAERPERCGRPARRDLPAVSRQAQRQPRLARGSRQARCGKGSQLDRPMYEFVQKKSVFNKFDQKVGSKYIDPA